MSSPGLQGVAVAQLPGVGPRTLKRLESLGIRNLWDLLLHLPLRYEDRTRIHPIGQLRPGMRVQVEGELQQAEIRQGRRRSLLARLVDGSGDLYLRWFHFSSGQQAAIQAGGRWRCFGEARPGQFGLEMVHPEYRRITETDNPELPGALTPVYPTVNGLTQPQWRQMTDTALAWLHQQPELLPDLLSPQLCRQEQLPVLIDALQLLHRPTVELARAQLEAADFPPRRRLVLEELLAYQLALRQLRRRQRELGSRPFPPDGILEHQLLAALPFRLTGAQRRVVAEISRDLARGEPMLRLVQGDVGSGKTIVATLAALQVIDAGAQVAIMAPTELLAEQHWRTMTQWLQPLQVHSLLLTGGQRAAERRDNLAAVADGQAQLVVGTHALFQDKVRFADLGLAVIDEQHRFGVHHRLALRRKGEEQGRMPHQLIMTATPIPRTLTMSTYADLDVSLIDELPAGRQPVITLALSNQRREEILGRLRAHCSAGHQAYWVCTLIEESEALQCQAAEDAATLLGEHLAPLRVGLVHGRIAAADKAERMAAFRSGELDILVATTVIEVGVDVPRATLMVIENAERLGLAQLHQLRGRVGRGAEQSYCLLLYQSPLGDSAWERLATMRATNDGFLIAQKDLELRGPGEVLGTRQAGELRLRVADLLRDQATMDQANALAEPLLARHPEQAQALIDRWVGARLAYGEV